jgi:hypothetical protein
MDMTDRRPGRSAFSKFLVPERTVSLKMLFDNLQNYAICTAIFAVAMAIGPRTALADPQERMSPLLLGGMFALGAVLLLLTALQSKALAELAHANVRARLEAAHGGRGMVARLYIHAVLAALFLLLYLVLIATLGIGLATALQGVLTAATAR